MDVKELVYCLCGELMERQDTTEGEIPVCVKCQSDGDYDIDY